MEKKLVKNEMLETYCAAQGWRTEVIRDLGSGMNRTMLAELHASADVIAQDLGIYHADSQQD